VLHSCPWLDEGRRHYGVEYSNCCLSKSLLLLLFEADPLLQNGSRAMRVGTRIYTLGGGSFLEMYLLSAARSTHFRISLSLHSER
jgi:hypothetical protein